MPIHLRAEPGDYADACLLPGDPLRAKYIAETFLDGRRAGERGARAPRLHRHAGTASRVSVQGTGMGCPSATIVFEELIQLGVQAPAPRRARAEGSSPTTRSATSSSRSRPSRPTRRRRTSSAASRTARPRAGSSSTRRSTSRSTRSEPLRVGPIVSSDLFYNPDEGQYERWSKRGDPRRRDGGRRALHARRAPRRPRRLPAHRERHRRRGRVRRGSPTRSSAPPSTA